MIFLHRLISLLVLIFRYHVSIHSCGDRMFIFRWTIATCAWSVSSCFVMLISTFGIMIGIHRRIFGGRFFGRICNWQWSSCWDTCLESSHSSLDMNQCCQLWIIWIAIFKTAHFFFTATIFAQVGNTGHNITLLAYDSSNLNFYVYSINFKSSHKFPRTNFRDKNHLPTSKLVSEAFRQEFGDSDRFPEIDEGELLVTM